MHDYEVFLYLLPVLESVVTLDKIMHMHTFYSNKKHDRLGVDYEQLEGEDAWTWFDRFGWYY